MSTKMLPLDIQLLIIERLPIKSLLRFRSVCKPWKSFISSSGFIARGYSTHSQQQHLIIRYVDLDDQLIKYVSLFDNDDQTFALTVPPLLKGTRVLDSCHGLLCMIYSYDRNYQTQMALLWNPAIRRSIAVVVPNVVDPSQLFRSVVAFGVCPITKDPNLVKITFISDSRKVQSISCIPFQVMVFTLTSRQWTCLPSNQLPRKSIQFDNDCQTVIGPFIYLVGFDYNAFQDRHRTLVMSFDLSTHEFREVDIPNSLHHSYLDLSRLRESLVLLHIDPHLIQDKDVFHVWMMMDDGDSKAFTKLFTINPPNAYVWHTMGFSHRGEPIVEWTHDLYSRESGEPVVEWTHDEIDGTSGLGVYEPGLGEIKDLGIRGNKDSFYGTSYTESLLLLDHEDGCIIRC